MLQYCHLLTILGKFVGQKNILYFSGQFVKKLVKEMLSNLHFYLVVVSGIIYSFISIVIYKVEKIVCLLLQKV